jgi:prepilin-type N-terminal cleavage/methylation domain-containing protein
MRALEINSNRGFSLIELMISVGVMGIVAISASTSFDTVSKMKHETDKTTVTADLRQKTGVLLRDPSFLTKQTSINSCMKIKAKSARINCYKNKKTQVLNINGNPLAGPYLPGDLERKNSVKFNLDGTECTKLAASCKIVASHVINEFCDWNGKSSECGNEGAKYAQIDIIYEIHSPRNKKAPYIELLKTSASITNQSIGLTFGNETCGDGYGVGLMEADLSKECSTQTLTELEIALGGFKLDGRKGDKGQRGIVGERGPRGPQGPSGCSSGQIQTFDKALALEKYLDGPGDIIGMTPDGKISAVNQDGQEVTLSSNELTDWAERGGGCFAEGTNVLMADGTKKKIESLKKGDLVWNPFTQSAAVIKKGVRGPEKLPLYRFSVDGKTIFVTSSHPMVTQRGVIKAQEVKATDALLVDSGELAYIEAIETQTTEKDVYNIHLVSTDGKDVEGGIVGDGIITGDLDMQHKLQKGIIEYSSVKKTYTPVNEN